MCGQCILDFLPFRRAKKSTSVSNRDHLVFILPNSPNTLLLGGTTN